MNSGISVYDHIGLRECDRMEEVVEWLHARESWLRQSIALKKGIPFFLQINRLLNSKNFGACLMHWVSSVVTGLIGTIALDGKTVRGSGTGGEQAINMIGAFAIELGLVLGQEDVASKSNEVTAVPELLDTLYIKGVWLAPTLWDVIKIARQIIIQKVDYLLAVKGNQPSLLQAVQNAFADQKEYILHVSDIDTGLGRIVGQCCSVLSAKGGDVSETDWAGCAVIGRIESLRQVKGKEPRLEQRYYISSRPLSLSDMAQSVRSRWAIENQLYWVLDVSMRVNASTIRKDNTPINLSLLKKIVLNILRTDTSRRNKASLRIRRKHTGWVDDLRPQLLGIEETW